jgi:hypothetical protein
MEFVPFTPVRQQKISKLEVLALHRPRNGFQARLLPAAAGLFVAKHFVPADHAGIFKMKCLPPRFGPEHEGRVAVGSPRNGDWAIGKVVLNQPMLRQDPGRVGFGDRSIAYTDQTVPVAQKGRLIGWYELGIFNGLVWKIWFRLKSEGRAGGSQQKAREFTGPSTSHPADSITGFANPKCEPVLKRTWIDPALSRCLAPAPRRLDPPLLKACSRDSRLLPTPRSNSPYHPSRRST